MPEALDALPLLPVLPPYCMTEAPLVLSWPTKHFYTLPITQMQSIQQAFQTATAGAENKTFRGNHFIISHYKKFIILLCIQNHLFTQNLRCKSHLFIFYLPINNFPGSDLFSHT